MTVWPGSVEGCCRDWTQNMNDHIPETGQWWMPVPKPWMPKPTPTCTLTKWIFMSSLICNLMLVKLLFSFRGLSLDMHWIRPVNTQWSKRKFILYDDCQHNERIKYHLTHLAALNRYIYILYLSFLYYTYSTWYRFDKTQQYTHIYVTCHTAHTYTCQFATQQIHNECTKIQKDLKTSSTKK